MSWSCDFIATPRRPCLTTGRGGRPWLTARKLSVHPIQAWGQDSLQHDATPMMLRPADREGLRGLGFGPASAALLCCPVARGPADVPLSVLVVAVYLFTRPPWARRGMMSVISAHAKAGKNNKDALGETSV